MILKLVAKGYKKCKFLAHTRHTTRIVGLGKCLSQDSFETISEFDGADKKLKHVQGKSARQSNDYECGVWVAAAHGEFEITINDIIELIVNLRRFLQE